MQAAGPDPWPGGCECGGGDTMNALAANERWGGSRRLLGPLSMQHDAIVQRLLDYHGSKVKAAESPGVSRATIYRKIHQYGIITRGQATPYRLNLRTASCHRRRRVTCRPSPLPRPVRQRSKLPGPGLAPGGEPPGLGT